jgi:hypothetical protein
MKIRFIVIFLIIPITIYSQNGIKFKIENLKKPDKLLRLKGNNEIFKDLILSDVELSNYDIKKDKKKFPFNIIANSNLPDSLVCFGYNSFFYGMYQAYADHRPFVMSPDMIWLIISQGFARHVNANAKELKHYFSVPDNKTELVVRNENIRLDDPNSPWELVFPEIAKQISQYTGNELIDVLTANYSTTTPIEKVASEITMMEAMKPYFEFVVISIVCGIPEITLEGTPDDWQNLLVKAQYLRKYNLDWWISEIEPLLKEFVKASKGQVDKEFWRNMFKYHSQKKYGAPKIIDGWIVKFFPYDKDGKRNNLKELNGGDNLPQELVKVDLKYVEMGNGQAVTTPLELWAGFVGLEQDKLNYSLKPKIAWMVRKKDISKDARKIKFDSDNQFLTGIDIRVKDIPNELLMMPEIYRLVIEFENKIKIPDELKNVRIGKMKLKGEISNSEIKRICKLFPNTQLIINGEEYNTGETSGWIRVGDSIPAYVLKKEKIWILEIWCSESELIIPEEIKNVKIDKFVLFNFNGTSEENIKRIKKLLPLTELYVNDEKQ